MKAILNRLKNEPLAVLFAVGLGAWWLGQTQVDLSAFLPPEYREEATIAFIAALTAYARSLVTPVAK